MNLEIVHIWVPMCMTLTIVNSEIVTLTTPLGNITGLRGSVAGRTDKVFSFMGIPYAKPPIGQLRFAKPVPYGSWTATLDATTDKDICMQDPLPDQNRTTPKSEDCLFLNIYVPNSLSSTNNKTVMVWIHGGGYDVGSGEIYDASSLAVHGDVIVVTINYRLGLFGFLSLGDDELRGNYGIWDMIQALRWVKSHISSFGGNPLSVTIFGESAGGFSVSLLSLIPSNKGLFQRVIAQSGVSNSLLAITENAKNFTIALGAEVGCNLLLTNGKTFLKCLQSKSSNVLQKAYTTLKYRPQSYISFDNPCAPVVDNELFMDTPENILSGPPSAALDFFRSLDMMIGNCDSEGSIAVWDVVDLENKQPQYNFDVSTGIPTRLLSSNVIPKMTKDYFLSSGQVAKAICDKYCVHNDTAEQGRRFVNMFGDLFFISPAVYSLNVHSFNNSRSNTFQYIFSKQLSETVPEHSTWFRGSTHATELLYLFDLQIPGFNGTLPSDQLRLSDSMKTYWTAFAKYGNPNDRSNMAAWPAYNSLNRYFLRLDDVTRAEMNYIDDRVSFWLKDIPNILGQATNGVQMSLLFSSIFGR